MSVDMSELANLMLEWEIIKKKLDEVEAAIKASVLQIGKTQTVGNVRASFSNGRKRYDYKSAAEGHNMVSQETISLFTNPVIDWRAICKHVGIDDVPFTQSDPSVTVKLI